MRILITGISGFIGQELSRRLALTHEVHGVYEQPHLQFKTPEVAPAHRHVVDLTDHPLVEDMVQAVRPEVVLDLAARSEVAFSFDFYNEVTAVNYGAVVNLAEACRRFVPDLRAFVMASTMEVYGNARLESGALTFDEDTPVFPMAPYAVAKLAVEHYLQYMRYAYEFPSIVLRQTNTYGRRDNAFFIVERIISQMLAGDECNLGATWPTRNFLFISDLVDLYERLLDRLPVGETFCTGPDNAISIGALARVTARKLDWHGRINWYTVPKRPAEVPYLNSSPAKAKRLLDWEPKVELDEGLDRTIAMWRETPEQHDLEPAWVVARGG